MLFGIQMLLLRPSHHHPAEDVTSAAYQAADGDDDRLAERLAEAETAATTETDEAGSLAEAEDGRPGYHLQKEEGRIYSIA